MSKLIDNMDALVAMRALWETGMLGDNDTDHTVDVTMRVAEMADRFAAVSKGYNLTGDGMALAATEWAELVHELAKGDLLTPALMDRMAKTSCLTFAQAEQLPQPAPTVREVRANAVIPDTFKLIDRTEVGEVFVYGGWPITRIASQVLVGTGDSNTVWGYAPHSGVVHVLYCEK